MSQAESYEEFVAAVDHGSVAAAARALDLPRATVSRRIARLEEHLGVRLMHRTTRRQTLTRQGRLFYDKARHIVMLAMEAEAEVRRLDDVPRGHLRVSIPTEMPRALLARWMAEFLGRFPEVSVELAATNQHLDLAAHGFDVALRAGLVEDPSLVVRSLGRNRLLAVASPAYLSERGVPDKLADLADHACIVGTGPHGRRLQHWPLLDGGRVSVSGRLVADQLGIRVESALHHLGITLAIDRLVATELAEGRLVPVLPDVLGREERVSLVYVERAFLQPKVRAFVDHIAHKIAGVRGDPSSPPHWEQVVAQHESDRSVPVTASSAAALRPAAPTS